MAAKTEPIEFFVFIKAETTGRQWEDSLKTKIVELNMIAVNRKDLLSGTPKIMPAALKMNMVFCPERPIQEEASSAHSLDDKYVRNSLTFNQSAGIIAAFLHQLPKPVCLVAHNGFSFDYKHLRGQFDEAGVTLPADLLCADSRWLFDAILKKESQNKEVKTNIHELYKVLFHELVEPTTAEEWTMMVLNCALLKKTNFLQLVESKNKLFSTVLPVGVYPPNKKKSTREQMFDFEF